jgi:KR domain
MPRSGYNDLKSQTILVHLHALDTPVKLIQGDVSNLQDVQQMFKSSEKPIAGIIHGAMVLRVSRQLILRHVGPILTHSRTKSLDP